MIVKSSPERHDRPFKLVQYDSDAEGRCTARIETSALDDQIEVLYAQRAELVRALEARVLAGEISPLAMYLAVYRMTPEEAATRTRLGRSRVRSHMTPKGFERARIAELRLYARIFDVSVADFLAFVHLGAGVEAEVEQALGGLFQKVTVRPEER